MTDVVLFHHAQGLTSGVLDLADRLRAAGHRVTVPDFYAGRTFTSLHGGLRHAHEIGLDLIVQRGVEAVRNLPGGQVYAGMSLGVLPAQMLAQTRPDARGAVLLHGCVAPSALGGTWPPALPVQIHGMDADPSFADEGDLEAAHDLVEQVEHGELFLYPGDRHLFSDRSLPDYDEAASTLLQRRVLTFLARLD